MRVLSVAIDLLREAAARKWVLALAIGITALLALVASALRMDVVDGALAATRLFGSDLNTDIQAVDVALRPVFKAAAYIAFYGGLLAGIVACADFAPALLAPGRIEHLLAQPLRRWHVLAGSFLGVLILMTGGALYGAGGFALILGLKTGVWSAGPIVAGLLAAVVFVAIYGAMLTTAVFVRSASLSALVGGGLLIGGIIAGNRASIMIGFESGWARTVFLLVTAALPRISLIGEYSGAISGSAPIVAADAARHLAGAALFGAGALAIGIWQFEKKDF